MVLDKQILDEDRVPDRDLVAHREEELDRLQRSIGPEGAGPATVTYLVGPTGTGKTMLAKLVFELAEQRGTLPPHKMAYLNTWSDDSRSGILYKAADELCPTPVHRNSTGTTELMARLDQEPDRARYLILDEADQLPETDVLYELAEAPQLYLILIANREDDLFAGMADRVRSRLEVGPRIECEAYDDRQIVAILDKRASAIWGDDHRYGEIIECIAAHADGNARLAIRALREAWAVADGRITRDDVQSALPRARNTLRQKSRDRLGPHQTAVLETVEAANEPLRTREVATLYRERVSNPRSGRQVRTYLCKLFSYNLIDRESRKPAVWTEREPPVKNTP